MVIKKILLSCFWILIVSSIPEISISQSHNYWTRSFNEESSLLSGAVVGGGSGPSAIYYNPASISEVTASKFSLNASLFSFDFIRIQNALGEGIDIKSTKANIEPRFISYMINSKKFPHWSFEIAFLNNENVNREFTRAVDQETDILTNIPGNERYLAVFQYANHFRDDWIGLGGSVKLNERFFVGGTVFVTIKSLEYINSLEIEAYSPNDSIFINDVYVPFYSASYQNYQYLKFNDYRLLFKAGMLYYSKNISLGLSITTPSVGGIYSDGKRDTRSEKQNNITMPGTAEAVPDYLITDYKEKKDMQVSYKTPFSIAAGLTWSFPDMKRILYTSAEFFVGIDPYRIVEADESPNLGSAFNFDEEMYPEWLTYVSGARPVLNIAVGYSTKLKDNLLLKAGFRTDFNYLKHFDYGNYAKYNKAQGLSIDLYYITCGLSWNIFGQDITTGLQYSVGSNKNQQQLANLSDPVEYNTNENLPLQGIIHNNMNLLINSLCVYLGASFNFGGEKKK
jgi:hypothetical protein